MLLCMLNFDLYFILKVKDFFRFLFLLVFVWLFFLLYNIISKGLCFEMRVVNDCNSKFIYLFVLIILCMCFIMCSISVNFIFM